jgi:uncharacterized small protein (DUF1192 family)
MEDLTTLSDDELAMRMSLIGQEIERRRQANEIPKQMDRMAREYLQSQGVVQGDPWRQPEGAHNAYPLGWKVLHNGKAWESTTGANVWEPGVSGWREIVEEPAGGETPVYPDFLQPTGSHDAYNSGDRVMFQGAPYESTINGNVWSPSAYPAGWTALTA